jgi:hypothetical protein
MTQPTMPTRRKALQLLAGVPMLPLSASASAALLTACGGGDDAAAPSYVSASFTSMAAPTLASAAAMATTTVGSRLNIQLSDNSVRTFDLAYQPFFVTGDMVSDGKGGSILSGGYYDIHNQPIIDTTVAGKERHFFSDAPDGTSLLTVANPTATAALTWIKMGSATSAEIEALADTLKPADIMTVASKDPGDASYTKIVANGKTEWIKVNAGMEKAAAFLETHRYAAYLGASMGFTKMEGTTVNAKDKIAYSALQNIQSSMVAGHAANVPGNGVSVPKQLAAGAVMALNLKGGQKDTAGNAIRSDWMPVDIKTLLAGEDIAADALGNTANPHNIANPDNLKFSEKMRTLFIGEDSSQHVNNFLWAYHIDTQQLSRIMSIPAGGESTGLHAVDEINGWTYIMSNFQHAGDWGGIHSVVKDTLDPLIKANYKNKAGAAVGYLTGTLRQPSLASG